MLANRLRHRIAIYQKSTTQDETTGAVIDLWQAFMLEDGTVMDSVPAEVLTGVGKEFIQAGARQGELTARFNLRWFPALRQDMRIVWENFFYGIESIETDITARQEYRLRAVALAPAVEVPEGHALWNNIPVYWDDN